MRMWTVRKTPLSLVADPRIVSVEAAHNRAKLRAAEARKKADRLRSHLLIRMGASLDFFLIPWSLSDAPNLAHALGHWVRAQGLTLAGLVEYEANNRAEIDAAPRRADI